MSTTTTRNGLGLVKVALQQSSAPEPPKPAASEGESDYAKGTAERAQALILADLDDCERAFLASCQKIFRQHGGCNTPFEEFFDRLVLRVSWGRMPTPDDVAGELETFRENWDDMRRDLADFMRAYPEALSVDGDAAFLAIKRGDRDA